MNKVLTALVAFSILVLAAWAPLETSNNSVVRLSLDERDFCSGVIVSEEYMATAAHCADSTAIPVEEKVYLPNGKFTIKYYTVYPDIEVKQNRVGDNGVTYLVLTTKAYFVRSDPSNDVAIYRVESYPGLFVPVVLSTADIRYGDKVYAMGMPLAIWGTISSGEVAKPRLGNVQGLPDYIPQDAIVHTAYMKPGISGGGLFNDKGELIGLTNWGISGGPYLATRVSHVIDLLKEIKNER